MGATAPDRRRQYFCRPVDNLRGGILNVADFSRKQVLLCRGNQRFRGKNAEGLLGLPRFSFSMNIAACPAISVASLQQLYQIAGDFGERAGWREYSPSSMRKSLAGRVDFPI
jgi:hypothetical protein